MGLDMYAFKIEPKRAKGLFAIDHDGFTQEDWENRRIHTWRSHSALDSLMHQLFKHKGGKGTFNCCFLQLSLEDLKFAEKCVKKRTLRSSWFLQRRMISIKSEDSGLVPTTI